MFYNRLAGPTIGHDVGFHDRVSFTIALDADLLSRFTVPTSSSACAVEIDLRAAIEQQAIHSPWGFIKYCPTVPSAAKRVSRNLSGAVFAAAFDPVAAGPGEPAVMPQAASSMLRPRGW
jgi:hypothetical protein